MPPKPRREPCRNFQSGRCQYGDRCKFLHAAPPQQKPNPFGFGSQTGTSFQQTSVQQQKPNPFGFGVQNSGQANSSGGFKPFENKWTRQGQPANQSQPAQGSNHECTDPAMCKRLIAEDFQNERPLWKLTCYGHYKHLPCDITGDISFEELRAEAYSDAKRGLSIQAIVEREKSLEKTKLIEYEKLVQSPYTKPTQSPLSIPSPFSAVGATLPSFPPQNNGPPSFPNVNPQQGLSPNMTFGVRPSTPPNNAFAQFQGSGPFGSTSVPSGPFGTQIPAQPGGAQLNSNSPGFGNGGVGIQGNSGQTSGGLFGSSMRFGVDGMNSQGNQAPVQAGGNSFTSNVPHFSNSGIGSQVSSTPSSFPLSPQVQSPAISQPSVLSNILGGQRDTVSQEALPALPADAGIWMKEEWKLGEIPEQPPPAEYVR